MAGFTDTLLIRMGVDTTSLKTAEAQVAAFGKGAVASMNAATVATKVLTQAFAGLAVGNFFNKAIRSATEYQTKLIDMGRVTKVSFDQLDARIKSMDANLGDATQLMHGYYQVISAGVTNPVKAQELLTDAAKLGKLAHIDQAETVKALTKIMQGYGDELKDTADAADTLITIERLGQTTVAELVPIIGKLSNAASFTGVNIQEMGGALALITQTAGSTAQAVTQLMMVLKSANKPTKLMAEAFASIGTTPMEFIKENGFVEFLKQVQTFGKNNPAIISGLVGGRHEGLLGFAALQKNNFEQLIHMIDEMDKKTGSFASAWDQYLKGMAATWDTFKNNVKNFLIAVGSNLLPGLTAGLKAVNEHFEMILKTLTLLVDYWIAKKAILLIIAKFGGVAGAAGGAVTGAAVAGTVAKSSIFTKITKEPILDTMPMASGKVLSEMGSMAYAGASAIQYNTVIEKASLAAIAMNGFKKASETAGGALNKLLVTLSGPKGLAVALFAVWELNKSLNAEIIKTGENTGRTLTGMRGLTKDLQSILSVTGTGGGLTKGLGKVVPGWDMLHGSEEDEAVRRDKNALAWKEYESQLTPYKDPTKVFDAYAKKLEDRLALLTEKTAEYKDEIDRLIPVTKELAMTRLNKWFEEQHKLIGVITPELQELYNLQKKQIMGPTPQEAMSESIKSVLSSIKELSGMASGAMKNLGMKPEEASKLFKEGILSKATSAADELVEKFDNPFMRQSFAQALESLGKQGGNAFLEQLGKMVGGGIDKLNTFKSQMEAYKTEMEKYNEAKKTLEEKERLGEANVYLYKDKIRYVEKIGMKYGENPEKGSYEEFFNDVIWGEEKELKAPIAPIEPKDTLDATAKKLMESLPEGLKKINVEGLFQPIQDAMISLVPAGEEAGSATGTALGNGMEIGALSAIERIKRAIAALPTTIDLSLSPDSMKGLSKQLAKELVAAGRE